MDVKQVGELAKKSATVLVDWMSQTSITRDGACQ
jgi:hypothetical protein